MSTNARDAAYQVLRRQIINFERKPGEALRDKELAEQLGMSRTPVREAMILLNLAKLVVVRPQSGSFVAPIDLELVEMEQFTRCAMEKEMCSLACHSMTEQGRQLYEENLYLYDFYAQSKTVGQEEKLLELDNSFHRIAFTVCGRERYFDRMLANMQHIERLRVLSLFSVKKNHVSGDHQIIAHAIMEGDEQSVRRQIEAHMHRWLENLLEIQSSVPESYFTQAISTTSLNVCIGKT